MAKTDMLTARCCMSVVTLLVNEDRLFHLSQFSNRSNRRVDHGDFEQQWPAMLCRSFTGMWRPS